MTVELTALADLEPALAADGFFEQDDVVAHVYVGYRSSDPLRRTGTPAPPEPCELPAVAYEIVKTFIEHKADLVAVHGEAKSIELDKQTNANSAIPWHPGAVKYFSEKGLKM